MSSILKPELGTHAAHLGRIRVPMKCPACETHTTAFLDLVAQERRLYTMPFVRTCPRCGTKIRIGFFPLLGLVFLLLFLHSAIEVGIWIAGRYGVEQDHAVVGTVLTFAVPFFVLLFLLWKYGRYARR